MSNFSPLDPTAAANKDPFMITSLTGPDARTGIYLDVDQENSSLLIETNNTPAFYADKYQNVGINTLNPSAQLDVNSSSGSCIQLTYNGSSTNKANMGVTSDGKLVLMAGGSEVNVDTTSNFNIKSHNGANSGLMLGNSLVLSTADQLNFNVVTPGTASNSKALVLNSAGSVSGITSLSATTLVGTLQTAAQPNIRTLDIVDITGHNGVAGLALGGNLVSSTAAQLNYTNTTPGTAAATKALVVDSERNISNINSLTASELVGTLKTAAQPNITSLGKLTGLNIDGSFTGLTDLSINTTETGRTLVVNDASGNCIRMYYDADTSAANYTDFLVDGSGNMSLTSSGGNVDITSHDGASRGIKLGGILVTATADQINYLQGTTPGGVTAGKAMIVDSNLNIANINALTASSLTGTLQTAAQPNISSVTALNVTSHNGSTLGLKLNGALVTATATELNYVDTTPGVAQARKAVVLDDSSDVEGIHALTAEELTGELQTAAQPNVTSVGTLSSLAIAGDLTVGSTVLSENELAVLDAVEPGTAAAGKALVLNDNSDIVDIHALTATELTGTLQTASQPNVTSVTTLNITGANGSSAGLALGGSLVTSTATELNYVDTTPGTAAATKALVLDANKDISGINSLSAVSLTGTLQTAAQPNVTSVGTLSSLSVAGDVKVGGTTLNEDEVKVLDGVVPGTVSASKALVVDANKDISTIRTLTATNLVATDVTGTLQTAAQPNITSVTTLDITGANGSTAGLKLGGVLLTATADQINSIFGAGGVGTFQNLTVNDSLTLANADGSSKGLVLGSTLMTASGEELNYLDGSIPGTVVLSKAVVVDANKDISSFRNLTAENLISSAGSLTMGATNISESEIGVLDAVTPGVASSSKALVVDSARNIRNLNSLMLGTSTDNGRMISALSGSMVAGAETYFTIGTDNSTNNQFEFKFYQAGRGSTSNYGSFGIHSIGQIMAVSALNSGSVGIGNTAPAYKLDVTGTGRFTTDLTVGGSLIVGSTTISQSEIGVLDAVTPGTAAASKAVVLDSTKAVTGISNISTKQLTLEAANVVYGETWTPSSSSQKYTLGTNRGLSVYSPTLNIALVFAESKVSSATYLQMTSYTGFTGSTSNLPSGSRAVRGAMWHPTLNKFIILLSSTNSSSTSGSTFTTYSSTDGTSWTTLGTISNVSLNTNVSYHAPSGHIVFFDNSAFWYSADGGSSWSSVTGFSGTMSTSSFSFISNISTLIIGSYVMANNMNDPPSGLLAYWNGSAWSKYTASQNFSNFGNPKDYHVAEDRIYMRANNSGAGSPFSVYYVDAASTKTPDQWVQTLATVNIPSTLAMPVENMAYVANYGVIAVGRATVNGFPAINFIVINNKTLTREISLGGVTGASWGANIYMIPFLWASNGTLVYPGTSSSDTYASIYSVPSGLSNGILFGSTTITETEIGVLDAVTPGTVAASKAVVVDANKDISSFRNLTATGVTATTLTGTLQTAAQPNVASVNALDITTHNGSTVGLKLGGSLVTSTATELNYIDGSVPGTVVPAKAVVVDGNKDISSFRNLTSVTLTSTSGSLTMGATTIDESEIGVLDAVIPGEASASKALVVNSTKDISGVGSLSASALTSTSGSLTMGATTINESEIGVLDAVTPGEASESKALVVSDSKNISGINSLSSSSLTLTAGSLTMGATAISEAEIAVLNVVTPGLVSESKAVVVDENKDISSFRHLTAETLTGTLQTEAQPEITSVGTLDSLTVAGNVVANSNLIIAGTTVTGTKAAWLAGATPGSALPTTALVVDDSKDIKDINSLTATSLTGTLQTAAQPNVTSVSVLDVTAHNGSTQGLKLGGVLLTATANQINSIFGEGGEGTFTNLTVNDTLTLANADGSSMGLKLGNTLVTSTGTELNYVDTTPGHAQASKALVFDENVDIDSIHTLTAANLYGAIKTASQPNITSVSVLDVTSHNGTDAGLKLGGVLLTATATQINSIFGEGGEGTFNNLTVNDTLTLANADGSAMGLKLGTTLLTASGTELNYLDGSTPGTATIGKALVVDSSKDITGINALTANLLTGTLQTAAQPNVTSVGTLTSLAVAGAVTVGTTVLSESEVRVLDAVTPGTVSASKALVVDADKDISTIRNLTAENLIATDVTGTLQTAAQPNITSVGELTSLGVVGDVNVGGNLNVGGTFISQSEIVALDAASPGHALALKAMITDVDNSIDSINILKANELFGTLQTAAQPKITSVGQLTSLNVAGDVNVGGNLNVGGTFISESEIVALDAASPGHAIALKAMITDGDNSIDSINSLTATSLTGTIQTAAQPKIASVNALDVTTHDGATVGLKLGGTLVTASATELNYVDTTAGSAQASKALVLNSSKDISGIHDVSMNALTSVSGSITSLDDSSSPSTGAITVAGGAGIAKSLYVGGDAVVTGALVVSNTVNLVGAVNISMDDESTSEYTGSLTTAGGVGIAKSLYVAGNATVVGNTSVTGSSTQAGTATITNTTDSTSAANGSIVTNGGVGIAKNLNVGVDASIGGDFAVNGTSELTGDVALLSTTQSSSIATGSFVASGGAGIAKNLYVGENVAVAGTLAVTGSTTQTGAVSITNVTDSSSVSSGSLVTAGGVGIAKNLNVGGDAKITNTTASSDATTGALVVVGGVGIGGKLNVGDDVHIAGDVIMDGNMVLEGGFSSSAVILTPATPSASTFEIKAVSEYVLNETGSGYQWNNGSSLSDAGSQLMQLDSAGLAVHTNESITDTTDSSSATTGALKVAGGVGIVKNLNVGANATVVGTLDVTQATTLSGVTSIVNTTNSTSSSTGAFVSAGGVGIAKDLNVGGNAAVAGTTNLTGAVTINNVADSSSAATGSLITAGGVGIAKKLYVGDDAIVSGDIEVMGTSQLHGNVGVVSETQSTSTTTGSIVAAGGVGIAKSLNVGETASIVGNVSIGGTTSQAGVVTITDDTESTNATDGSLVTAGGMGITKNLNVAGTAKIANAAPSTSATTGALVVSGGAGIASDLNVGGDLGVAGDFNLIGDINLSGKLNTTNVHLTPDLSSPFSTAPLTTITQNDTILAISKTAGIGYINSASAIVTVPSLLTKNSVVYYATNGESTWATLALDGAALSTYEESFNDYIITIEQVVVSSWSGKIWLAGSFSSEGTSTAVVMSGDLDNSIDTLYVIGSSSSDAKCISIAVATDDNNVAVVYQSGSAGSLYYMNIESSAEFASVSTGAFKTVAWLNGLGKFVATRTGSSSMYCSSDVSGSSWASATTPSAVAPNTVYFNSTINLAVAVGDNFLWYSTNGVGWTNCSYPALAGANKFNAVMNSPVSALIAVYSHVENTVAQMYYTLDAINWTAITLAGPTFGYSSKTSAIAISPSNYAYAVSVAGGNDTIQKIGPITSASMIYGVGITSGYLKNESATGYQWFNNSTPTEVGDKLMDLTTSELAITPIVDIINSTNSTSTTTGSLVTAGGAGIAKSLNVGMNAYVGGDVSISGALAQAGIFAVTNSTDASSTSTGSIVTAGGVGIAKSLKVGTSATIGGAFNVSGSSALTGSVSISSTTESSSSSVGSLTTAGGVGIAKSLNVGIDARIGGDLTIVGATTQTGVLSVPNSTDSSSTSTGAITTTGGVGIAKQLYVGDNAYVVGEFDVTGETSLRGVTTVVNSTDATSSADGALHVNGGVGIAKSLFVGTGASVGGALAVAGDTTLTGDVSLASATNAVSVSTGSLVTAGGVGIAKSLYVGTDASITGDLDIAGLAAVSNDSDSTTLTTGSITTAGGVGIAKTLRVGSGIYGTLQTAAQPNISSVTVLNITGANATDAGLSLNGALITATAPELNYLDGSTPGAAVGGKALVFDLSRSITNIQDLTADTLTGEIQTSSQPLITSVSTLNVTSHDGLESGLSLGGTLLMATAEQLNSLVAGTSESTFARATVSNNLTLSGANGTDTGLVIGSTLVTATGTELNYVDTTPGLAEPSKALVLNSDSDISGIHALTASTLTGTIQTASQPLITSVSTLNITGHNGSTAGLALGGVLVTSTAEELNYLDTTAGSAQVSKALVLDGSKNITGINSLSATSLTGTLQTAAQPNVTSVGTLTSLAVSGDITSGATVLSETDLAKIDSITNGAASADKALVLDAGKNIAGINSLSASVVKIGAPTNSDLPLEVGTKSYTFTGAYAFNNDQNAHGIAEAGSGVTSNYSMRTDGKILVTGEVQITSDKRLKKNITNIQIDTAKQFVMESQPIRFNWKNGDSVPELGFLAQSVFKINPDLVTITPHPGLEEVIDEDGFVSPADAKFTLATGKIIPLLTMTTKDLYALNEQKDQKIADLEARLAKLEAMFAKMV